MNEEYQKLDPEEQEQVNGGGNFISQVNTTVIRPGKNGRPITADNRFDCLAGLTTLQIQQIPRGHALFNIAQEFLIDRGIIGGSSFGNNGGAL